MDDGLKITHDKSYRSSSSLVSGTRSDKKLDIRASIPEDDQFANAEARCDDLQEKIDLVRTLRKKKKLKKRSMTTITEPVAISENVPLIKVRTQPKRTLLVTEVGQHAARLRRLEVPHKEINPMRSYQDPDILEQQQMLSKVHGFNQNYNPQTQNKNKQTRPQLENVFSTKAKQRARADGDEVQIDGQKIARGVAGGNEDASNSGDENVHNRFSGLYADSNRNKERHLGRTNDSRIRIKNSSKIRAQRVPWTDGSQDTWGLPLSPHIRQRSRSKRNQKNIDENINVKESRPVVELFKKPHVPDLCQRDSNRTVGADNSKIVGSNEDMSTQLKGVRPFKIKKSKGARRWKSHTFSYEQPTVSSRMKQVGMRCYDDQAISTNIPFIISKSTAPSHNVGVNLQQVLHGLKTRQPLSGIPLTIAHHMGLHHDASYGSKGAIMPTLHTSEINVIKLGGRLLRLSSYKNISYSRLLTLYREGEGIVPRFLRAMSRPHYFYSSEDNLAFNHGDYDATAKGWIGSQEAKRSLAAYSQLYREYEQTEKKLLHKYDAGVARRHEKLARDLAAGEEYIRKVVQEFKPGKEMPLRATASTIEDGYRPSTYKLHENV